MTGATQVAAVAESTVGVYLRHERVLVSAGVGGLEGIDGREVTGRTASDVGVAGAVNRNPVADVVLVPAEIAAVAEGAIGVDFGDERVHSSARVALKRIEQREVPLGGAGEIGVAQAVNRDPSYKVITTSAQVAAEGDRAVGVHLRH